MDNTHCGGCGHAWQHHDEYQGCTAVIFDGIDDEQCPCLREPPRQCQHMLTKEREQCRHGYYFGTTCEACMNECTNCWGSYSSAVTFCKRPSIIMREGNGVVENPGTPSSSVLICLGCGQLPPHTGSETLCPACAPPNGTCSCPGCALVARVDANK